MHYTRMWRYNDPDFVKIVRMENPKCKIQNCNGKYLGKGYCGSHYYFFLKKPDPEYRKRVYEYNKIWLKTYPRTRRHHSFELQLAMNNVRKRDNNTCQWYGCDLTYKETTIQVNHIFPISEYPELELIEEYMICYCKKHHALFHGYRGDSCASMLGFKKEEKI